MKTFFAILTVLSCAFISNVEGTQQLNRIDAIKQVIAKAAQYEREILLQNCHIIRANIAHQYAGMGSGGSLSGSGFPKAIKQGITNYLNSVGTPTARQLLIELQSNGFKDFI